MTTRCSLPHISRGSLPLDHISSTTFPSRSFDQDTCICQAFELCMAGQLRLSLGFASPPGGRACVALGHNDMSHLLGPGIYQMGSTCCAALVGIHPGCPPFRSDQRHQRLQPVQRQWPAALACQDSTPAERPLPAIGRDAKAAQDLETDVCSRQGDAAEPEPHSQWRTAPAARTSRRSAVGAIAGDLPRGHVTLHLLYLSKSLGCTLAADATLLTCPLDMVLLQALQRLQPWRQLAALKP